MKIKGLQAKYWEQRSWRTGEGLVTGIAGSGWGHSNVSYLDIVVYLYISQSEVKRIMKKCQCVFRNGKGADRVGAFAPMAVSRIRGTDGGRTCKRELHRGS